MSKLIDAMLKTAKDMDMEIVTIKELEALNLADIKPMAAKKIKKLRLRERLSQAVMAKILNVTPSTYQKWERGEVTPKGGNLKLLILAENHGIDYIMH